MFWINYYKNYFKKGLCIYFSKLFYFFVAQGENIWKILTSSIEEQLCVTPRRCVIKWENVLGCFDLAEIIFLRGVSTWVIVVPLCFCKPIRGHVPYLISSAHQTVFICKSNLRGTNANVSVCCWLSSWSRKVAIVLWLHLCLVAWLSAISRSLNRNPERNVWTVRH